MLLCLSITQVSCLGPADYREMPHICLLSLLEYFFYNFLYIFKILVRYFSIFAYFPVLIVFIKRLARTILKSCFNKQCTNAVMKY